MFGLTPYRKNQSLGKYNNGLWDFERMFDDFFGDSFFPDFYGNRQMRVDIKENEKEFVVEAELPGINKEEINISLNDNYLTISVDRKEQIDEEKENFIRKERKQFSMQRSFYVDNVDNEKVDANFNNGILAITLPKKEAAKTQAKNIQIN